jgi:hypothetical protein
MSSAPENVTMDVNVLVELIRDGKVVETRQKHNLVVNNGKADMAKRLVVAPTKLYQYMKLGHSGTAPASSQSTLTSITGTRRTCNTAALSGSRTAKFVRTWTTTNFSATGIREAGLFNQRTSASGTMLARVTFTAIAKTNADTLKITWTVKVV